VKGVELLKVDQILRPASGSLHSPEIVETSDWDDHAFELNLGRWEQVTEFRNPR
jgi:hypothetical protein